MMEKKRMGGRREVYKYWERVRGDRVSWYVCEEVLRRRKEEARKRYKC